MRTAGPAVPGRTGRRAGPCSPRCRAQAVRRGSRGRGPVAPASRRPPPGGTSILARLAFQRVRLVLADSGMMISSAGEYALLGTLLLGAAGEQMVRGSQPEQSVAGLRRRPGELR